jgi:ribose transport system substrate-binding protein
MARDAAKAYFGGERDFPEITYTESACITKDNVDKYYDPNATF